MKKNTVITSIMVACSVISTGVSAADDKVRWRLPLAAPAEMAVVGQMPKYLADTVNQMSGGDVQFRLENPGKIVPAFGIFDALKEGKIDAGYQWIGYDQGKIPAASLLGGAPYGMEHWEYLTWMYGAGGEEVVRKLYEPHNIMPILCGVTGPETAGWYRKEITSLEDLKGLKIRASGLAGKVYEELGASVTVIPASELYQALELGVIDATEFSMPPVDDSLGFAQIAKYNYFPGWHQTSAAHYLLVNLNSWNELSDKNRALIESACKATNVMAFVYGDGPSGRLLSQFETQGVTTKKLPPEMVADLRETASKVIKREAENDQGFKAVLDSMTEFETSFETWKQMGYLPRELDGIFTYNKDSK